jgi:hypothetical protein
MDGRRARVRDAIAIAGAADENPWMPEFPLPVPDATLRGLLPVTSPLRHLASLPKEAIVSSIRDVWNEITIPTFRRLADAILAIPLKSLSTWNDEAYLTFDADDVGPISITGPRNEIPASLRDAFPVESADGFEVFLTYFGGMRDWEVGHSGHFFDPQKPLFLSKDGYEWGEIGEWEGSLPLYHGGTGDCILIRRDGVIGVWSHENAWEGSDEACCWPIEYTFLSLMDHFAEYIHFHRKSEEKRESPFYY